jgi:CubicO group peptidase (beta-lactamase class C family)
MLTHSRAQSLTITLRQLLSLTSGIDADHGGPGTRYRYGPAPYQVFGEVVRRKLRAEGIGGEKPDPVEDYLKPRILDPIGATPEFWRYTDGDAHLPSGSRFTAHEWIKYGEFIRLAGRWGEDRIIPGGILAECFTGSSAQR